MNSNYSVNDPLAEIYNESYWRINRVSPMYNLQYSEIKLKQYATKICQALMSDGANGSLKTFKVLVQDLPRLKYSNEDFDSLKITITLKSNSQANTKETYVAIFLSWGLSVIIDNSVHLPYMLERGDQRVGTNVKNTIQKIFDCNIKQYNFNQEKEVLHHVEHHSTVELLEQNQSRVTLKIGVKRIQLLRFGFDFIEYDTSRHTDPFVLTFKNPQDNLKDKFTLTFEVGDIHIIWNSIKDEDGRPYDLITQAFNILQNQIHHMTTLDVTVYDLCQVSSPKAVIKSSGVAKMKTPEIINSVFTILNEISPLFLRSFNNREKM